MLKDNPKPGKVISLQVCPGHRKPMLPRESVSFVAGLGIAGDRHALEESSRQVLAMEKETLDALGLSIGLIKENITTTHIDLMSLKHKDRILVGPDVILEATKPCAPCNRMDEIRPGLLRELAGKRGMLFRVIHGGDVKVGAEIRVIHNRLVPG